MWKSLSFIRMNLNNNNYFQLLHLGADELQPQDLKSISGLKNRAELFPPF